jgi:hypothetical protein
MLYVHKIYNKISRSLLATHRKMYTSKSTSNYGCIKLTNDSLKTHGKLEAFLLVALRQATKEASRSLLCAHNNVREDCFNYLCTTSCVVTTRHQDCTGSTVPIPCIQTCRLAARLLVGHSHWLS